MHRPHTLGKIGLTYGLCGVLTVQPAMANVVVGSASSNTSKTQAGNGVEVINIATPRCPSYPPPCLGPPRFPFVHPPP